jgi:hypothetical protein
MDRLRHRTGVCAGLILSWAAISTARAGILNGNSLAMAGFTGQVTAHATNGTDSFTATVDYAVFAPGNYPGTDPSNPHEYVYAYQITNSVSSTNTNPLFRYTVGLYPNGPISNGSGAHNAETETGYGSAGAIAGFPDPTLSSASTSFPVYYLTTGHVLTPGSIGDIALFTSPNAPTFIQATVSDGVVFDNSQNLPTPSIPQSIPEPATLGLGFAAAGGLILRRRRK